MTLLKKYSPLAVLGNLITLILGNLAEKVNILTNPQNSFKLPRKLTLYQCFKLTLKNDIFKCYSNLTL